MRLQTLRYCYEFYWHWHPRDWLFRRWFWFPDDPNKKILQSSGFGPLFIIRRLLKNG